MFDHSETGFYDDFVPLKNNTDKKEPAVAYTDKANRIDLQTARGYRSYSGVLSKDAVLIEADAFYRNFISHFCFCTCHPLHSSAVRTT